MKKIEVGLIELVLVPIVCFVFYSVMLVYTIVMLFYFFSTWLIDKVTTTHGSKLANVQIGKLLE